MRIVIVEDGLRDLLNMRKALLGAGHKVLAILVEFPPSSEDIEEGQIVEYELPKIISAIHTFNPDKILLDHSLDMSAYTGENVASGLKLDKEKLVGTSTSFSQEYCGDHFWSKDGPLRQGDASQLLRHFSV